MLSFLVSQAPGSPCLLGTWSGIETASHLPLTAGSAASKKHPLTQRSAIPAQLIYETIALRITVKTDLLSLQSLSNGNQPCLDGISNVKGKHLPGNKNWTKKKTWLFLLSHHLHLKQKGKALNLSNKGKRGKRSCLETFWQAHYKSQEVRADCPLVCERWLLLWPSKG